MPQYPKSDPNNEPITHIPVQSLPAPPPTKKPSEIFPLFSPIKTYAQATEPDTSTAPTLEQNLDENPQLTNQHQTRTNLEQYITDALVVAENYIEKRLNEIQEQLAIFTISLLTTNAQPSHRKSTLRTANQSARRVFRKRMIHHFVNNQIKISLQPLQEQLVSLANSIAK